MLGTKANQMIDYMLYNSSFFTPDYRVIVALQRDMMTTMIIAVVTTMRIIL